MQKLSGLVFDIRDDEAGEVLRSIWPSEEQLPDLVKTAQAITPELDAKLPDDLFALVLRDGDVTMRKFACIDAGNTALSVEYFLKTAHKLPAEAQQVGASNLVTACGWYDIDPPEQLQKIALGVGGALMGAMVAPGAVKDAKKNLAVSRAAGGSVLTPDQVKAMKMSMYGG
jgi:hypothetical protein